MKKSLLTLIIVSLLALPARAGILDVDYIRPSPTKALAYSLVLPGGGFFYLAGENDNPYARHTARGLLFLGLTTALTVFTINQAKKEPASGALMLGSLLVGVRIIEFGQVTTAAEEDRHAAYKIMLISEEAEAIKRSIVKKQE